MSLFFQRLRAALAPDYSLLRKLASGGMATVYLARETALDRLVAVKVLRPELATARATERFVREAQILAKLSHPNIVPVHTVDQRDGVHFYVMDYLEGDTVQRRLERNEPLTHHQARKLGRDLLEALEAAHGRGIIHRDVKPANVFLLDRRAILTDFGIAKHATADGLMTDPHFTLGTVAYMAPELLDGAEASERSDVYAAGMVIYEAFTARRWAKRAPEFGDWSGMRRGDAHAVRRALELDPSRRWKDAASFRRSLWRTRSWPYRRNAIGIALGCTTMGLALGILFPRRTTTLRLTLGIPTIPAGLPRYLGDSVACGLAQRLNAYPEVSATCPAGLARLTSWWSRGVRVQPEIENDSGRVLVHLTSTVEGIDGIEARSAGGNWSALVDSLADRVSAVLFGTEKLLDPKLSPLVLPKTPPARLTFLNAERAFSRGHWGEARLAYTATAVLDATCWICYWRHNEVGRWFDLEDDPADSARYRAHLDAFPEYYQSLMRAESLPEAARLDSLQTLSERWRDFLFGQFRRGDELLHRGPLVGRPRRSATAAFEEVYKLQPLFAPGLQHLAWVHIAEGDSAQAEHFLVRAERFGNPGDPSFATLAVLELAHAWRFLPREEALRRTETLLGAAQSAGIADLDAGARYLPGFGSPEGELALAERLLPESRFARSAGVARVLALVGLGRPDTATSLARGLAHRFPDLRVFASELAAALILFDADSGRYAAAWPAARSALVSDTSEHVPSAARQRAAWMLEVAEQTDEEHRAFDSTSRTRIPSDGLPAQETALLRGASLAMQGHSDLALQATEAATGVAARQTDDPFFRTTLHLLRARWYERLGRPAGAERELVWQENSDLFGYPKGDPQPAEVDWAFTPLAEWRLAGLLERSGGRAADMCRAYRAVARLWAHGEPRYRARAETAVRRITTLGCDNGP